MQATDSIPNKTEKSVQVLKIPVPKCARCHGKVALVSGVVIYGGVWYHSSCWKPNRE